MVKRSKTDVLMFIILALSGVAIIAGALLKIGQNPAGDVILKIGILASLFFCGIEIWRLRRIIARIQNGE